MFQTFFLRPLSLLYGLFIAIRHLLYDYKLLKSYTYQYPIIVIGNLTLGGSGKTPHTIYLTNLLSKYHVSIISRGYGRKTKQLIELSEVDTPETVGDEPYMMSKILPKNAIYVSNKRIEALDKIAFSHQFPIAILDDALQHRAIQSSMNILITEYHNLYSNDYLIPFGTLRDLKRMAHRASIIIVSKSPTNISQFQRDKCIKQLQLKPFQQVLFSSISYLNPKSIITDQELILNEKVIIVSAIANANLFAEHISFQSKILRHFNYRDHYSFQLNDIHQWISTAQTLNISQIICTQKDSVKIKPFESEFTKNSIDIIYIPIEIYFTPADHNHLANMLHYYIKTFGYE